MNTPGMATPRGGGAGAVVDEMRQTCTYICGECHVEQEIKPKVGRTIEQTFIKYFFINFKVIF